VNQTEVLESNDFATRIDRQSRLYSTSEALTSSTINGYTIGIDNAILCPRSMNNLKTEKALEANFRQPENNLGPEALTSNLRSGTTSGAGSYEELRSITRFGVRSNESQRFGTISGTGSGESLQDQHSTTNFQTSHIRSGDAFHVIKLTSSTSNAVSEGVSAPMLTHQITDHLSGNGGGIADFEHSPKIELGQERTSSVADKSKVL